MTARIRAGTERTYALSWHDGTLSIAWWAVLVLAFLLLVAGGTRAAR